MQMRRAQARECGLPADRVVRRAQRSRSRMHVIQDDDLGIGLVDQAERTEAITATEAEGRHVRIRGHDRGRGGRRERAQQMAVEDAGLLEVVDVDVGELPRPLLGSIDGEREQAAVVGDPLEGHDIGIDLGKTAEHLPGRDRRLATDPVQIDGVEAELARPRQHGAHVVGEAEGGARREELSGPRHVPIGDGPAQQVAQARILFGSGEQTRHRGLWTRSRRTPHQRIRQAVERRHRGERTGGHAPRQSATHGAHRIAIVRDDEGAGRETLGHPRRDRLPECRRRPRARSAEDGERAGPAPVDDALLRRIEGHGSARIRRREAQDRGGHGGHPIRRV